MEDSDSLDGEHRFTPTESMVFCELGLRCRVVLLLHQIDAGGSMLLQTLPDGIETAGTGRYILCDAMALEAPTDPAIDAANSSDDT